MVHCRLVAAIVFGILFTGLTCYAAGRALLAWLSIKLDRVEALLFSFVLGSALVSFLVFLLAAAGWLSQGAFLFLGIGGITAALVTRARDPETSGGSLPYAG